MVVVAATAHLRAHRERARAVANSFLEVYVRASQAEVEARDAKGLYAAARAGRIQDLPGAGAPYEAPEAPEVVAEGGEDEAAAARVCELASAAAIPARPAS